jgi:hypothetical protein
VKYKKITENENGKRVYIQLCFERKELEKCDLYEASGLSPKRWRRGKVKKQLRN